MADEDLPEPHDGMTPEEKGKLLLRYVEAGEPVASFPECKTPVPLPFHGAALAGARLASAYLKRANLRSALLSGADLLRADLGGAWLMEQTCRALCFKEPTSAASPPRRWTCRARTSWPPACREPDSAARRYGVRTCVVPTSTTLMSQHTPCWRPRTWTRPWSTSRPSSEGEDTQRAGPAPDSRCRHRRS